MLRAVSLVYWKAANTCARWVQKLAPVAEIVE